MAHDVRQGQILEEVVAERARHDEQWGGSEHDDQQHGGVWIDCIYKQLRAAHDHPEQYRDHMLKVAALAVASLESCDRRRANPTVILKADARSHVPPPGPEHLRS
jgi:hypothetical protein